MENVDPLYDIMQIRIHVITYVYYWKVPPPADDLQLVGLEHGGHGRTGRHHHCVSRVGAVHVLLYLKTGGENKVHENSKSLTAQPHSFSMADFT